MIRTTILALSGGFMLAGCSSPAWVEIDDFETTPALSGWTNIDVDNQTEPFVENPQISERRAEGDGNHYMLRKPAAEGIVGNRKALGSRTLPFEIAVGETATLYARINIEAFPNNHSFGLSNLSTKAIAQENYNAFEPMIRVTDKRESNGTKNDGTLMVLSGENKAYATIEGTQPAQPDIWYEIWAVIDNRPRAAGGQRYDLYVRGGEYAERTRVFTDADFRMRREQPLGQFIAISNTGPTRAPYGNGGVRYDDLYLARGETLSTPH